MKKIAILLAGFFVFSAVAIAQPVNDICQDAIAIGALTVGSQRCTAGTNVAANPEFPFPFQNICSAGSSSPSAADDVWYTFTTPASSNELIVNLTGNLPSYSIAIYRGTCGSLSGYGCATGGAGGINNVTIQPLAGGQTYYMQVSGNGLNAEGTFNLCLTPRDNPNLCVVQSSLTANPAPVNGSYNPGQVITFCYTVSDYNQLGANWFHGLQIILGTGWQAGSLQPVSPAASCDASGNWAYYNSVTSSNTGNTVGPGFFYDRTPLDGNPGNNYGDNCSAFNWTFCFRATVPNINCNSASPDLSIRVRPFSDGQTGSWSNQTCNVTPTFVFSAVLVCCSQPIITQFDETCPNACDGIVIAQGQGGTAPYTYSWGSGSLIDTASNLCAGPVNITVTDAVGCNAITTVVVNSGSSLSLTTAVSNETCPGAADGKAWVVNGSPSLTYTWNTVPPQSGDTAFALTTGTYQVSASGIVGCSATANAVIGAGANLSITLGKRDVSCTGAANGKAWVVSGNANFTYAWGTAPPQTGDTAFNLAPGTYSVTATGPGGCSDIESVTIIEPTQLTGTATADTLNCGAGVTGNVYALAAGGTAPYSYSWNSNPVQNTATATNLAPGTYTVTVTDGGFCTVTTTATVVSTASFTANIGSTDVTCNGAADGKAWAIPTGGQAPFLYTWSTVPPQSTDTAFNLSAGSFSVIVTDFNNCTAQYGFLINEPAVVSATRSITNVSCNGLADGEITVTPSGGRAPYSYLWSNASTSQTATGLVAGTYDVQITDANSCVINLTGIVVTEPAILVLTISPDSVNCFGGFDGGITLAVAGGTPTYTYQWSNNRINQNLSYVVAGNYSVTVTDRNSCTADTTVTVGQPADFAVISTVANVSCFGAGDGSIDVVVTGATPPYQYGWSANANSFNGTSLSNLSGASYQITVTDSRNCTKALSFNINEPTRFRSILNYSVDSTACDGTILEGSILNNTNGGTLPFSYVWSSGDTTRDITSNLGYGTYTLTASDANGCADTAEVTLVPKNQLQVLFLSDSSGCYGDSSGSAEVIITGGRRPYFVDWVGLDTTNTTYVGNLGPGNYDVIVTDSKGCDTSFNFTITEQPAMSVTVPDTLTVIYGLDTTFTAQVTGVRPGDVSSLYWDPSEWLSCDDCVDPILTAIRRQKYIVTLDVNGCIYYDTLQLMVDYEPDPFFIPNAFTPNGDNVNDQFQIFGVGIKDVVYTVHNRWGGLVFSGQGMNATWDGTYNSQEAQVGMYVYNAYFIFLDNRTERVTGTFTLLR